MQRRLLAIIAVALAACRGSNAGPGMSPSAAAVATPAPTNAHDHGASNSEPLPLVELDKARRAAAKYRNVQDAVKDGYKDINVVLPNMGRHFLKEELLDATFDAERPELLVYTEEPGGRLALVAVEYAVPLKLRDMPPEGFTGAADQWFSDARFQLWTLHAWVFRDNPEGTFHSTNPLVK